MSGFDPAEHGIDLDGSRHGHEMTDDETAYLLGSPANAERLHDSLDALHQYQAGHHGHVHTVADGNTTDIARQVAIAAAVAAGAEAHTHGAPAVTVALDVLHMWGFDVVATDTRRTPTEDTTAPTGRDTVTDDDYLDAADLLVRAAAHHPRYDQTITGSIAPAALLNGDPTTCRGHVTLCAALARPGDPSTQARLNAARDLLLDRLDALDGTQ